MEGMSLFPIGFLRLFFVSLIISIILFLLFREVFCWYWKINKRISIAEKQILLLENILAHLKSISPNPNPNHIDREASVSILIDDKLIDFNRDIYESLSSMEQKEADKFFKLKLRLGEKIAINKTTREIKKFSIQEWMDLCAKVEDSNWQIIWERKLN